ncbi:hypothetical protein PCANC_24937 [Puccinia coronata f. sp. avenae]|uniref:Uncharacterized protein n=1 Tax=Puccinia coronata f. sp. avenae TaxID=200324 RepID=A0A2N5S7T1_9BASI|nr:hypothetical protein PCANC_24937 [Puccinia coronata f. sp. avenae]
MDCRLMAGVDLWRAKLPKVAAEGGIGPPPPSLAASVAAPLEDNYTLRAAKVRSRSRDGSSVGDALTYGASQFQFSPLFLLQLWCRTLEKMRRIMACCIQANCVLNAYLLHVPEALTETPSTDESKYKPMQMAEKEIQKQYSPKEAATSQERKKLGDVDIADQNSKFF